jgi:Tfp pilus assembly protein PilV
MRRYVIAAGILTLLACQAASATPESRAVLAKHQLSECMMRRMSANRNLSYNDAMRTCKERLQPPKDTLASITPVGTGAKSP